MNFYGINILDDEVFKTEYDKYYKEISLKLKNIKDTVKLDEERINLREELSSKINIEVDIKSLKENFINILNDENSPMYLWLLYSKYDNSENYIDKISNILKQENQVFRGGINLYKLNGWMTHSLYAYQLVEYNIAKNKYILNFNEENNRVQEYVDKLHNIYNQLTETAKFLLKILVLIHDIGVIENVAYHDKVGYKYVDQVLKEIGITQKELEKFNIGYENFKRILEEIIKYHTIMSLLSGENSDKCVEDYFKEMLDSMPNIPVKQEIAKIIYIFTFADIIAVNEILMDEEKFERLENAYIFFEEVMHKQEHNRNKEKVALDRICDMCRKDYKEVSEQIDDIFTKFGIDKKQFMEDMYNVKWLHYTGPLMKTLNNLEISIHVFYEVMELIKEIDNKNSLSEYIITFVPNRPSIEYDFINTFKNNMFFEAINMAKTSKEDFTIYEKITIEKKEDKYGKHLNISVME